MKLFVNGCSHTEGTELALDGDLTQAWPYKLQQLLQHDELHNSSCAGGSNDRVTRTTVEDVMLSAIPPDLAVVQFTDPYRFETPDETLDEYKQFLPHTFQAKEYDHAFKHGRIDKAFCIKHYNWSSFMQRRLLQDKMLTQIMSLQNLFENQDIPYVFIIWWELIDGMESTPLFRSINKSNILNYDIVSNKLIPMDTILHSRGYKLCNKIRPDGTLDKHYTLDGHQFIAESILSFITHSNHLLCRGGVTDLEREEIQHYYD